MVKDQISVSAVLSKMQWTTHMKTLLTLHFLNCIFDPSEEFISQKCFISLVYIFAHSICLFINVFKFTYRNAQCLCTTINQP